MLTLLLLPSLLVACDGGLTPLPSDDTADSAGGNNNNNNNQNCESVFRFDPLPEIWPVPSGYTDSTFRGVQDTDGASPDWVLTDIGGDGLLDIVVTSHPDIAPVGTSTWLVHAGSASGFADAGSGFGLPSGYPDGAFSRIPDPSTASPNWAMGGLGKTDLIFYEIEGLTQVGTDALFRHKNSGGGFESSSSSVGLPPGYPSLEFRYGYDISSSNPNWGFVDIDGDGDRDLVVTGFDGIDGVGEGRWLVHLYDAGNYSSNGMTWLLPAFGGNELRTTSDQVSEGTNWELIDLDGDDVPELVVTLQDGVDGLGDARWQVYSNKGNAFDTIPKDWNLPAGLTGLSWVTDRSDDGLNWALADLTGSGRPDLVVTYGGEGANGTGRWEIYRNNGKGFADEAQVFLLPNGLASTMARRFTSTEFVITDVDSDGLVDMLVARNTASSDLELGVTHWYRYSALCD